MAKRKTSHWMTEHVTDPFVKQAQKDGYRSRAAYKLLEMNAGGRFLKPGATVVDLGSAPGGWSQVAAACVGKHGKVAAIDLLAMAPVPGVDFIQGDFSEDEALHALEGLLNGNRVDTVLSDMSPNISGVRVSDQARAELLWTLALDFAVQWLKPDGNFIIKVFQGSAFNGFLAELKRVFKHVTVLKPKASRDRSPETYLWGSGLNIVTQERI